MAILNLARIWRATRHSWSGLVSAVREESAFRQELLLAAGMIVIALSLPFTALERVVLIAAIFPVMIAELLNSAVEAAIDRISLEHHELSKRAKDYGSAAVFLALGLCALIWGAVVARLLSR